MCRTGLMSRCPGYVDVTVDDWTTSEELFHYDLAVMCPPQLSMSFYLPYRGLADTNNRTFLVTLNDSAQRHQVFLTAVQRAGHSDGVVRGQLSEVGNNDNESPELVLLIATSALFVCLTFLSTSLACVTHRSRARSICENGRRHNAAGCCWKVAIGAFLMSRAIYSVSFTFSGAFVTCRLIAGKSGFHFDDIDEDLFSTALTAMTDRLHRRVEELERDEGLSSPETEYVTQCRDLYTSVTACDQYIDNLLMETEVQFTENTRFLWTSLAFGRLQQVRANFLASVTRYIDSEKARVDRVVAKPAVASAKEQQNGLFGNDWLRYPRSLFFQQLASRVFNTTSANHTSVDIHTVLFAEFLETGSELNSTEMWTTDVGRRYIDRLASLHVTFSVLFPCCYR